MTETHHLKDIVIFIQAIKNFILKATHFLRFNAIDGSIEMLKNSWISKNFNYINENFKNILRGPNSEPP